MYIAKQRFLQHFVTLARIKVLVAIGFVRVRLQVCR